MKPHDVNSTFINGFVTRQPIRLQEAFCRRSGVFSDDSFGHHQTSSADTYFNACIKLVYLLPPGLLSHLGIDGATVVTVSYGEIECIAPWSSIEYVVIFRRPIWKDHIPECLRKLADEMRQGL